MHTRSEVAAQLRGMGFENTLDFAILDAVDACNCDVQAALEMLLAHSVVVQPQLCTGSETGCDRLSVSTSKMCTEPLQNSPQSEKLVLRQP